MVFAVLLISISEFGFHGLGFLFGVANVEFMVWISYQDVIMRIVGCEFPILIACCGFQGLDFLSRCQFRLSKRGNQVDGWPSKRKWYTLVWPPKIDLNKSCAFACWLCPTHACWDALAPAKLPMKELSGMYYQYPWSCDSGPDCY